MSFFTSGEKENPYLSDPDVVLMLEFQKGDKASFERLMERNYKQTFNLIYRFVNNKEIAEDLTQDVFLKVYRSVVQYRPQSKFRTWVYQIAKNICLNELRRQKREVVSLDETVEGEEGELKREVADQKSVNPQEDLSQKEKAETIKKAIYALPQNQRMAVILRRYENLSYEEIARTLGCSVPAVKSLLSRAKESLKEKLSGLIEDSETKT